MAKRTNAFERLMRSSKMLEIENVDDPESMSLRVKREEATMSSTSIIEEVSEIQEYLEQQLLPPTSNPLEWWSLNKEHYSNLVPVALKYLGIPGTSVSSERMFSKAGQVVTPRRQRLSPHSVEKLVFLHDNII